MADEQYVAVVNLDTAMHALGTMIETRRGYLKLIEQMIAPYPLQHQFDQSKRNQMVTLLSRADTLWVLLLVHSESKHAARPAASAARAARKKLLGAHLTRATIARGLAIVETGNPDAATERRHTVAASRLVEAGLAYGLFEMGEQPDAKQLPIVGTAKLASFLHALGDHAYWVIKGMIGDTPKSAHTSVHGVSDIKAEFDHELSISRHNREGRITAEDIVMDLLE